MMRPICAIIFLLCAATPIYAQRVEERTEVLNRQSRPVGKYDFSPRVIDEGDVEVRISVDLTTLNAGTRYRASLSESFDDGVTWTPVPLCRIEGNGGITTTLTAADIGCNLKQTSSKTRQIKGSFEVLQGTANTKVELITK